MYLLFLDCDCFLLFFFFFFLFFFFFFQAEDGIRDLTVTGVQTCALPISRPCRRTWLMTCLKAPVCIASSAPAKPARTHCCTSARPTTCVNACWIISAAGPMTPGP